MAFEGNGNTTSAMNRRRPVESVVALCLLVSSLPAVATALVLLWTERHGDEVRITLTALVIVAWIGGAIFVHHRVVRPLNALSNLLGSLREGDYSIRGAGARADDALGLVLLEINTLGERLNQ